MATKKKYTYKIIDFLAGAATVCVRNEKDFDLFLKTLSDMGLESILVRNDEQADLNYWRNIALINGGYIMNKPLYFEYSFYKGMTFSWDEKIVKNWWEESIYNAELIRKDYLEKTVDL